MKGKDFQKGLRGEGWARRGEGGRGGGKKEGWKKERRKIAPAHLSPDSLPVTHPRVAESPIPPLPLVVVALVGPVVSVRHVHVPLAASVHPVVAPPAPGPQLPPSLN